MGEISSAGRVFPSLMLAAVVCLRLNRTTVNDLRADGARHATS
jgi:hypothetical protein